MSEPEGIRVKLDDIMGYTEIHSRWERCGCGNEWCGYFVNWTVRVDPLGRRTKSPERMGVKTICPGPKKRTWFQWALDLLIKR